MYKHDGFSDIFSSNNLYKNNLEDKKKSQTKNNLDTNSIDQKAKQFADFFNGEIVNLE